jgi:Ion channel
MLQRNQEPSMQKGNCFTNNIANDRDENSPLLQQQGDATPLVSSNQLDSTQSFLLEQQSVAQTAENSTHMKDATKTTTMKTSTKNLGFSTGFVSFLETASGIKFAIFHVVLFYVVAILAFSFGLEKWSIIDSLYFATITFTSVGTFHGVILQVTKLHSA